MRSWGGLRQLLSRSHTQETRRYAGQTRGTAGRLSDSPPGPGCQWSTSPPTRLVLPCQGTAEVCRRGHRPAGTASSRCGLPSRSPSEPIWASLHPCARARRSGARSAPREGLSPCGAMRFRPVWSCASYPDAHSFSRHLGPWLAGFRHASMECPPGFIEPAFLRGHEFVEMCSRATEEPRRYQIFSCAGSHECLERMLGAARNPSPDVDTNW